MVMSVKQSNRKLFVSDLDGTLLKIGNDPSKGVSDENKIAITKWVEDGNVFAVATARSAKGTEFINERLGFKVDSVGSNGGEILVGNNFYSWTMEPHIIEDVVNVINKYDMDVTTTYQCNGQYFRVESNENKEILDARRISVMKRHPAGNVKKAGAITKINLFVNPLYQQGYFEIFKSEFNGICEVTMPDTDMIDFVPLGCTKASGVKKLADHYGIDYENVAVIGDSDNDISMISMFTHNYCMENAMESVKKIASKSVSAVHEAIEDFSQ